MNRELWPRRREEAASKRANLGSDLMNFDTLKLKRWVVLSGASVLSRRVGILGVYHFKNHRKLPVS